MAHSVIYDISEICIRLPVKSLQKVLYQKSTVVDKFNIPKTKRTLKNYIAAARIAGMIEIINQLNQCRSKFPLFQIEFPIN